MLDKLAIGAWGQPPCPLLPLALRRKWASEAMPAWICDELRLPAGSTYERLDESLWRSSPAASERVLNVLATLARSRIGEVSRTPVVDPSLRQDAIDLRRVPLSTRSRNALDQAGLLDRPHQLSQLNLGDLLRLSAIGIRSCLEIACLVESVMKARTEALAELGRMAAEESAPDWLLTLEDFANKPWATSISERDPRFAQLLPDDSSGTVAERIESVLEKPDSLMSIVRGPHLLRAVEAIDQEVARVDQMHLEDALNELLVASGRSRAKQVEALLMRFGWTGAVPLTLEDTGRSLGVTRERIRQIESRFVRELPERVHMPQLDAAIELLENRVPLARDAAAHTLLAEGVTGIPFAPEAIIATAAILKRQTDLRIEDLPGKGAFLVGSKSSVRSIASRARRLAGMAGAVSVYQLTTEIEGGDAKLNELRQILRALPHVEFLNDDWYWVTDLPSGRNRLSNVAKKILSVAQPQTIHSIRDGVRRAFRFRAKSNPRYVALATPPSNVLAEFFKHSPEFILDGDGVRSVAPLSYIELLGDVDRAFVEIFRSTASGVLDRYAIQVACAQRGLNENSVSLFLTYSPIIEHVGIDIWKLRGVSVDPASIEALREANASELPGRRLLSFGWNPDGKLWVAARLPKSLASMVLNLPGSTKRFLINRRFAATDKLSLASCGHISVNESGTSFGYGPYLRLAGAEPGDVLLIEFDLSQERVYLSLTGEVTLDQDGTSDD